MRGSSNPLHSNISNRAGADSWNRARRDGKTKVELDGVLKRPVEVLDIEEGMPMKLGSIWEAPKGATSGWSSPENPRIAKLSKASR